MARTARYYLGRVSKLGTLTDKGVVEAIRDPAVVESYGAHFTFTQITHDPDRNFIFGHLSKFEPEGEVPVVRLEEHAEDIDEIPGLLVAASPFVYIPEFSGIAYQHVWNRLERGTFERVFALLIEEKYNRFMVNCRVEALADLRTFVQRIAALDRIEGLRATVHPPNPSFSPLWRSLRDYMRRRRATTLEIKEDADEDESLETPLPSVARRILEEPESAPEAVDTLIGPDGHGVGDAAVLMAADGYGRARVEGTEAGRQVIIRTKETQIAFKFDRVPEPDALYERARSRLLSVSLERKLGH